jgi:hypothetical protein
MPSYVEPVRTVPQCSRRCDATPNNADRLFSPPSAISLWPAQCAHEYSSAG